MKIVYVSWLRNRIGKSSEDLPLPEGVSTVEELVGWLCEKSPAYAPLAQYRGIISVALNGAHAPDWGSRLRDADEIAFFSPIAGG